MLVFMDGILLSGLRSVCEPHKRARQLTLCRAVFCALERVWQLSFGLSKVGHCRRPKYNNLDRYTLVNRNAKISLSYLQDRAFM